MHVQDLKIANDAWDRGAGVMIAVNKWDLIDEKETNTPRDGGGISRRARRSRVHSFYYVSAKTGQRVPKLFDGILNGRRRPEARPNRRSEPRAGGLLARQQPPQPWVSRSGLLRDAGGHRSAAVCRHRQPPREIPESYARYLHNGFREAWEFTGAR